MYKCILYIAEHLRHHHITSLREQLQVAGGANNSIMQSTSQTATVTTPGTQKSIFSRLGIRKPSILSLSSPLQPSTTSRTFSLDDLLRPLPRRKLMQSFFFILICTKKEQNYLFLLSLQIQHSLSLSLSLFF
jgi:hypothetical protein